MQSEPAKACLTRDMQGQQYTLTRTSAGGKALSSMSTILMCGMQMTQHQQMEKWYLCSPLRNSQGPIQILEHLLLDPRGAQGRQS